MNFRTETLHVWQLTAEEDEAVLTAIRHYLESPQSSDAESNRREVVLQGVLQGRMPATLTSHLSSPVFRCGNPDCHIETAHSHRTGTIEGVLWPNAVAQSRDPRQSPIILPTKPQPGQFICPNLRCYVETPHAQTDSVCGSAPPPGPPTTPVVEAPPLTDEQKARIAAEAAKVQGHAGGATRLATWEGADK